MRVWTDYITGRKEEYDFRDLEDHVRLAEAQREQKPGKQALNGQS